MGMLLIQTALWCACGRDHVNSRGVCPTCERRGRLSRERFGGQRERVLERDGERCQCCGAIEDLLVHHRRRGSKQMREMITLRRGCHTRIHHTLRPSFAFPEVLRQLWREQHPDLAEQLCLPLTVEHTMTIEDAAQAALFEIAA